MIAKTIRTCFPIAGRRPLPTRPRRSTSSTCFPCPTGDAAPICPSRSQSVVKELAALPVDADMDAYRRCHHPRLAHGRPRVTPVSSPAQILRGVAEGLRDARRARLTPPTSPPRSRRAVKVAFQAVRKPIEGTILTGPARCLHQGRRVREAPSWR
ncbi:MAG: hypothetical protein ACLTSX_00425 [Collinsella sp.]